MIIYITRCIRIILVMFFIPFIGYQLLSANTKDIPIGEINVMVKFIIVYLILQISIASVISCFVFMIRNQVIALIVALVYGSGIPYEIMNALVGSVLKGFDVMKYVPIGNAIHMSLNHSSMDYIRSITVAIVFILLSFVIGTVALEKVDVK